MDNDTREKLADIFKQLVEVLEHPAEIKGETWDHLFEVTDAKYQKVILKELLKRLQKKGSWLKSEELWEVLEHPPTIEEEINETEEKVFEPKPKPKKTKRKKAAPSKPPSDKFDEMDRVALLEYIKEQRLPVATKGVNLKNLRDMIRAAEQERTEDLLINQYVPSGDFENIKGTDELHPALGVSFDADKVKKLIEFLRFNSEQEAAKKWIEKQRCNFNCQSCNPVLQQRCYSHFIGDVKL